MITIRLTTLALAAIMIAPVSSFAQKKKKDKDNQEAPKMEKKPAGIQEKVKSCKKSDGLFTMYQDTVNGTAYLLIKKDQLNKEFIYFTYTENGVTNLGHFRGSFRDNKIFSLKRYYDKLEFRTENTAYWFDPANALSKASDANITAAILASQKIIAEDAEKGELLVEANNLFLTEIFHQVKPSPNPGQSGPSFSLGSLSKDKSKIITINNYPANTDVIVEYVYENPSPVVRGGNDVTDSRNISIRMQHSLIEVPKNNFIPRSDDPRIGFFTEEVEDLTATNATNYRDVIHRWHLEKKDKNAAISEPVEPIVWWIENTTPMEFRETIKTAALRWNEPFEKAGFKNAVVIKEQPDNADWHAGDIRYNVLRWTSSPEPPFGGYGPSFTNPRTGQILGADIMLEYIFVTNRLMQEKLFDAAALNLEPTTMVADPEHFCSIGNHMHHTTQFGLCAMNALNLSTVEMKEYIMSSLYYLVLHEMGHTLGLNHNMKSSQLYSPAEINNKELTGKNGLTGSVMDYPAVNLSLDKSKQGHYFTQKPGPYDFWAVEYGYSPDADAEKLSKLLERSTEPQLSFGNDADDMRFYGFGIDPRVMIGDMSSDAITYSTDRIKLCNSLLGKLKDKYSKNGQSYHDLRISYLLVTGEYNTALGVVSKYIGGIYVDRGFVGQKNTTKPFTPVAYADQKRAMGVLSKYAFAPDAFKAPENFFNYLQMQRRGFNFFFNNEDPKIHDRILNMQKNVLNQLMHANVTKRMTDSRLYGNTYTITEMFNDLTASIFIEDLKGNVNTYRQNLQAEYTDRLIAMSGLSGKNAYDHISQAAAVASLKSIQRNLAAALPANAETSAHRQLILLKIKNAFEKA